MTGPGLDPRLDAAVADAAEAWLRDPRDAAVYARLVLAVESRRAARAVAAAQVAAGDVDEADDGNDGVEVDLEPVGTQFADPADPRAALDRLRRGLG